MALKQYGYFPGCVAQESCKELDLATHVVAEKLGWELIKLDAASCCGASVVNDMNRHLARMLNARTFAEAEALGLDTVLTICSTCTGHMRQANHELLHNEQYMKDANDVLARFGKKYSGNVVTKHMAWILRDDFGIDNIRKMRAAAHRHEDRRVLRMPRASPRGIRFVGRRSAQPAQHGRPHPRARR